MSDQKAQLGRQRSSSYNRQSIAQAEIGRVNMVQTNIRQERTYNFLAFNQDPKVQMKDGINLNMFTTTEDFAFKGDPAMQKLKLTMDRQNRTYDERLYKSFTELLLLAKIKPNNTNEENHKWISKAHDVNSGKAGYETEIGVMTDTLFFDKIPYLYAQNTNSFMMQKVGATFKQTTMKRCFIKGYHLVQLDNENKQVDLRERQLIVDFRECRRKELPWATDKQVENYFYRLLILDPQSLKSPVGVYVENRETAMRIIEMVQFFSSHQKYLYFTRQGIYVWQVGRAELLYQAMIRFFNMGYYQKVYANRELYKQVRNNRYGHSSDDMLPEIFPLPANPTYTTIQTRVDKPFSVVGQSNEILGGFTQREVVPSQLSLPVRPKDLVDSKKPEEDVDPMAMFGAEPKTAKPFDVEGVFTAILSQLNFGPIDQEDPLSHLLPKKDPEIDELLHNMVKDKEYNKVVLKEDVADEQNTIDTPRSFGSVSVDSLFQAPSRHIHEEEAIRRRERQREQFNASTFVVAPLMIEERGNDWRPQQPSGGMPGQGPTNSGFRNPSTQPSFGDSQQRSGPPVPGSSTSASEISKQFVRHPSFSDPVSDSVVLPVGVHCCTADNKDLWLQFRSDHSTWDAFPEQGNGRYGFMENNITLGDKCTSIKLTVDGADMGPASPNQTADRYGQFVYLWQGTWGFVKLICERFPLGEIEGISQSGSSGGQQIRVQVSQGWEPIKRAYYAGRNSPNTIEVRLTPLALIRVRCPALIEAREGPLLSVITSLKSLEISTVCRSVLTRLGRQTFGPELLNSGGQLSPEEAGCAVMYSVCAGLPLSSREKLYEMALGQAVQNWFPNERGTPIDAILSREGYLAYSDLVEFFHEDTATLLVSPWAKLNLARRLETALETPQRIESSLLASKVLSLHLQSIEATQPKAKTPIFDSLLLERSKVLVEASLQPLQALSLALWMECQLHHDPRPARAREPGLSLCQQTLTFTKCLMQVIDPERFQILTDDPAKGSLDSWLMPLLMANFAQVEDTPNLLKFWDLQCVCSLFTQSNPNIPLSAFQLVQVWLVVDSIDTPVFHDDMRNLAAAIAYNLSLPIDQLLYSLCNFLFDTLSKSELMQTYLDVVRAQLKLASNGPWRLSEVVSLLGVKFGLSGPGILAGLEAWDSMELPPGEGQSGLLPRWKEKKLRDVASKGRGRSKPVNSYLPSPLKTPGPTGMFGQNTQLAPRWKSSTNSDDALSMYTCDDVLKNLLIEKASLETPSSPEQTLEGKLAYLKFLEVNGIHDTDEANFDQVQPRLNLEELVPELKPFLKEKVVLQQLLSSMTGLELDDQIQESLFNLFTTKPDVRGKSQPKCSIITMLLAIISTLPDSNAYKQTLFISLFNFLRSLFAGDSTPPHLLPGMVCVYTWLTTNPTPLSYLVPCPIVSCMLGTSALISDDALGMVRRQWAYRMCTAASNSVILHPHMIGKFCAGVLEKAQPGFEVTAKLTYWDADGNLKQSVREISEPIIGLVPPVSSSTPSLKNVVNLGEWRGTSWSAKSPDWERTERLSEANIRQVLLSTGNFFEFSLTYAGLDRFSYTRIPQDKQLALRVDLSISQPSLGSLILMFTKDLDLFSSANYLTKPPELNRQSTSQAGYSVYTALAPLSLILQPVFVILLYLRTSIKNLLSKEPTAGQIANSQGLLANMDKSFLMLSCVPGMVRNGDTQLDPEHSLLKVPEHLNSLLSTGVIDVVASLSN